MNETKEELNQAENMNDAADNVADTIDEVTGSSTTNNQQRVKRAKIETPNDCRSFLLLVKDFNKAIGSNPRKANIKRGLQSVNRKLSK